MNATLLEPFVSRLDCIRLVPSFQGEGVSGFVLEVSESLVLMRTFLNFIPDGFTIARLRDWKSYESQPKFTEIIVNEGYAGTDKIPKLRLTSMQTVLEDLLSLACNVKLECNNCGDAEEAGFHIGRIIRVTDSIVDFCFFTSEGKWFDGSYPNPIESITLVEFDSNYINTFSKYLDDCPVPRVRQTKVSG